MEITNEQDKPKLHVGDLVVSTPGDDYSYLVGKVLQIAKQGTPEHISGNPCDDVYVDFKVFEYSDQRVGEIEDMLESLHGEVVRYEDAALDEVIMAPDNLICITGIDQDRLNEILSSRDQTAELYYAVMRGDESHLETRKEIDMENKTEANMPLKLEISARPIEPIGNLLGFANITINDTITVKDFKILESENGLFVGMPSKADPTSKTGFRNTVYVDKEYFGVFNDAVIGAYHTAVKDLQTRAAKLEAEEKPPAKEQLKAAAKQAEQHNAEIPAKGKVKQSREDRS